MIPLLYIDITYNVNVPNKNDSGLDMMMTNFDIIPNFRPALWII